MLIVLLHPCLLFTLTAVTPWVLLWCFFIPVVAISGEGKRKMEDISIDKDVLAN